MGQATWIRASCMVCAAWLALGFAACTTKRPFRVPEERIRTSIPEIRDDEVHRAEVERHSVEEHPDFALAFVEFDDQGQLRDPAQLDRAEKLVLEEAGGVNGPGAVVVVFVHGWRHNASVCDENVVCFREVLTGLDNLERLQAAASGYEPRRIVGIYLGWRGLTAKMPGPREMTFYKRKAAAHRIGEGQALDVFLRLEGVRDHLNADAKRSRLVIVGHSFGGALVYSALSSLFEERLANAEPDTAVEGVGDLVVLINPAFEAARYTPIHEMSSARADLATQQPAALVVVTSETDSATRKFFRLGRKLSTLFKRGMTKEEKQRTRTAVGHYEPYRTHWMEPASSRGELLPDIIERTPEEARGSRGCRCRYIEVGALSEAEIEISADTVDPESMIFAGVDLQPTHPENAGLNPFVMIGTTDEVVTNHNGMYNRVFIDFLRSFVVQMEVLRDPEPDSPTR